MTPKWFNPHEHSIPYDNMWEEARKWLPGVISKYFNAEYPSYLRDKQFIHRVEYHGGKNSETGEEFDVWHGMGEDKIEWVDELPTPSKW